MTIEISDEMKTLEHNTRESIPAHHPLYIRVDGRSFSTFTRRFTSLAGENRAFNEKIRTAMDAGCQNVYRHFKPQVMYHQSDEASFGWFPYDENALSQHPFNGKIQKLSSVVASAFTTGFVHYIYPHLETPELLNLALSVTFDARVVDTITMRQFQRMFYWRYLDCNRNSVQMFMQQHFSQKQLQGVKLAQMNEMIATSDHLKSRWDLIDDEFKYGTFIVNGDRVQRNDFVKFFQG